MGQMTAIAVMLLSCASYALSYVLQHKGTQASIGDNAEPGGGIGRLITHPIYVGGVILFGVSFGLHLFALSLGSVSVIQLLIVTQLIFIPPFAAIISHAKIHLRDWIGIIAVAGGLVVFLVASRPTEGSEDTTLAKWLVIMGVFLVLAGLLWTVGARLSVNHRAALYGIAAGLINALLALLAKGTFDAPNLVTSWLTYATVVCGIASIAATAIAFRSGPITTSSPAMIAVNPIASTFGAMYLFGETLNGGIVVLVIYVACIVAIGWGIIVLTKSEAVHAALGEESTEPADAGPRP